MALFGNRSLFKKQEKPAFSDEQKTGMVYDMLVRKGDDAVDAIKRRIAAGEGITIQGHDFSLDNILDAVEMFEARQDDENTPNQQSHASKPKVFAFVSTRRSRKDDLDTKIKARLSVGTDEPGHSPTKSSSRHIDVDEWIRLQLETVGHRVPSEHLGLALSAVLASPAKVRTRRQSDNPPSEETYFRVHGKEKRIPILQEPNVKLKATAYINRGEVFAASEVSTSQTDGRVYARLTNGRGWVGVTSRADVGRSVVVAIGKQEFDCLKCDDEVHLGGCMQHDASQAKLMNCHLAGNTVSPVKRNITDIATPSKKRIISKPSIEVGSPPMFDSKALF